MLGEFDTVITENSLTKETMLSSRYVCLHYRDMFEIATFLNCWHRL